MKNLYPKKTIILGVKQFTLLIGLLLARLYTSAQAPDFAWAKQAQGNFGFSDESGYSIAHDSQGNSYVTGAFQGTVTFGNTTLTSYGSDDIFVAKYNAAGNVLWAKNAGGPFVDGGYGIAVDGSGNSYVTGFFNGTATFGSISLSSTNGSYDVFVAKYDASGNVLWAKKAGGTNPDQANSIAVDVNGNSYVAGSFQGSATFGSISLTSSGLSDVFLAKFDASGNVVWAKKAGGSSSDIALSVAIDGSGFSYITGKFQGSATFGSTTITSSGSSVVFVAKYDATGNVLWAGMPVSSVSYSSGNGITVDGSGNSYVTGDVDGDIFVAKLNTAGTVQWAAIAGSPGITQDHSSSIAIDGSGNSYVTGYFQEDATFGSTTLTSSGLTDIFVAKYDAAGNVMWAKNAGGISINETELGNDIAVDGSGNSYITGVFYLNAVFGSTTLINSGLGDVFVAKYDASGNVLWATNPVGTATIDFSYSIALDASGNSYITGSFQGSATFGSTTLTSSGGDDVFVAKYDGAGNVVWAKKAGGSNKDVAFGIAIDGAGNSYITGHFQGSATFGSITLTSSGSDDVFIVKYDASGNVLWVKKAGGSNRDNAFGIALDGSGNSYITGSYQGSATFGSTTLTSSGGDDVFISKFDAAGNVLWAKKAGGTSSDIAYSIAVDGVGNSYIAGSFSGSAIFASTTLTSSGGNDIFIAKCDASGNVLWAKKAGGTSEELARAIAIDAAGNSYVTGSFHGSVTFGNTTVINGTQDVFVAKYDAAGNVLWAKQAGGTSNDQGRGIAVDGNGNSYVTGSFERSAFFGSTMLNGSSASDIEIYDVFVAKYDAAGNVVWAKQAGGVVQDIAFGITVDGSGNSYITGSFQGSAIFGNITLNSLGAQDVFIAKINAYQYTLTTTVTGSGIVTKNPNQTSYQSGTSVQLTATPDPGFQFVGWSGSIGGNTNPVIVTMNSNKNITATFTALPGVTGFNLMNASTDQSIQQLVSGAVLNLATLPTRKLNIRALTNPATVGSVVFNLSGQQSKTRSDDSGPHYSLQGDKNGDYSSWTPPVGSYTLTARTYSGSNGSGTPGVQQTITFTVIDQANPPVMYTLSTPTSGNGTVNRNPNQTSYASGSTVTLTAMPAVGYQFSGWSGDATGTTNPLTITMNSNKNITATFTQVTTQYSLNVSVNGSGSVAKNPSQTTYLTGTSVQLTALPLAGFQFSGWSGDATGTTNPLSIVMNNNKNITATFTAIPTTGVTGFNLMNASTDQSIQSLVSGAILNLATLPTRRLNIRALTNPTTVGSVGFNLSGQETKVRSDESGPHYSLFGDSNGDYSSWTPTLGSYTLTARTYTGANGSGTASAPTTITFTVIDQASTRTGSAQETVGEKQVKVSPNPFKDALTLELLSDIEADKAIISLSTLVDKTVNGKEVKVNGDRQVIELDRLSKLPSGMYLLKLQLDEKTQIFKVIKQ